MYLESTNLTLGTSSLLVANQSNHQPQPRDVGDLRDPSSAANRCS